MLHPCKDAAILRCSYLIFSKGAMCLIASPLSISITGCVLSEGTCRTTLNPLQPADLDKGQPRLTRRFWSHCWGAREDFCPDWLQTTDNVFLCIWTVWLHSIVIRQVCAFDQYDLWLFLHCAPQHINLVLSAVTAITDKVSSTYVFHTIVDNCYSDKHRLIRNNICSIGMMSFLNHL